MIISSRARTALLALAIFAGCALGASPTSFCKCTCFTNSTIIPLDAPSSGNRPYTDHGGSSSRRSSSSDDMIFLSAASKPEGLKSRDDENAQAFVEGLTSGDDEYDNEKDNAGDGDKNDGKKDGSEDGRKEYRAGNCNDCNRQFCLDYNLPICKKASMDDVFTTCFQRDSRKDEAVVFIFIVATVGLLAWAAVRPWVAKWYEKARERRNYIPVAAGDH